MRRPVRLPCRWAACAALVLGVGCTGSGSYDANTAPTMEQHDLYFPISEHSPGSHYNALVNAGVTSANVCTTCHDATSNTPYSESTCTGCHTNAQGMSAGGPGCGAGRGQSLECTDDWHNNAGAGAFWVDGGQATCVLCHANDEVWRVADHATRVIGIPFDVSSRHSLHANPAPCLQCHLAPRNEPQNGHPAEPWALDFHSFDCSQCHLQSTPNPTANVAQPTDALHVNPPVPNYTFGPTTCIACHGTGNYLDGGPPQ